MSLLASVIANDTTILAEEARNVTNLDAILAVVLKKISQQTNDKMSFSYENYLLHYVKKDGITAVALADERFPRRIAFAFLEDVTTEFTKSPSFNTAKTAPVVFGAQEFSKILSERMDFYNTNPSADKIRNVRGEIDQVRDVMTENIERVLERGERIEILVDKTDNLNTQSLSFRQRSTELRRQMWWKNQKLVVLLMGLSVLTLYFFVGLFCGLPGWGRCTKRPH